MNYLKLAKYNINKSLFAYKSSRKIEKMRNYVVLFFLFVSISIIIPIQHFESKDKTI